ncbi:MAG: sigma-70 family RNA polymerase sigma factor [Ktedonobacteraceae bacterium]
MRATPQEYHYHQRLCARGDPTAFAELAEKLYDSLVQDVRRRAGVYADPMLVEEAVGQALLDYQDKPVRYDPNRMNLHSYLVMAAYRDFQNAEAREHRVAKRQISLADPAFLEFDVMRNQVSTDSAGDMDSDIAAEEIWIMIGELFPDPTEQQIVELIVNHVRSPEPYAQLLHLQGLPADEQLRQVRHVKYRITRRLQRNLARRLPRAGE